MKTLNHNQINCIESALLSAIYYISESAEAICDRHYMDKTDAVLTELNNAIDLLRTI